MALKEKWSEYTGVLSEEILLTADDLQNYLQLYGRENCGRMLEEKFNKIRLSKIDALYKLYDIDSKANRINRKLLRKVILSHVPVFEVNLDRKMRNVMAEKKLCPGRPAKTSTPEYDKALCWLLDQYF